MILDENKKITSAYEQIGKLYFDKYKENADSDMQELISLIEESYQKIATYEENIKELKGVTRCPKCGAEIDAKSLFCPACGTQITKEESNEEPQEDVKNVLFCTACGWKCCRRNQ